MGCAKGGTALSCVLLPADYHHYHDFGYHVFEADSGVVVSAAPGIHADVGTCIAKKL